MPKNVNLLGVFGNNQTQIKIKIKKIFNTN